MIDIQVRSKDRFVVEFKIGYVVDRKRARNDFVVNTWMFVPDWLGINAMTYTKKQFYRDVNSVIRLMTPVYSLQELAEGDALPFRFLEVAFREFASTEEQDALKEVEYQVKMFCSIVKSALRRGVDRIREERGGTYHVAVETSALPSDRGSVSMSVSFETRPEITDLLISDVMEIMDDMCRRGPDDVELSNARKYLLKRHAEQLERKEGRLSVRCGEMADYIMYGYNAASGYAEALAKVTPRDVRSMASRLGRGHVLLAVCRENTSLQ